MGDAVDLGRSTALIFGFELDERTIDLLWAIFGPELYLKLTHDVGYSRRQYEAFLLDALQRATAPVASRRRSKRL